MDINLIIVDNFYRDPDKVRENALKQDYIVPSWRPYNWKGKEHLPPQSGTSRVIQRIAKIIGKSVNYESPQGCYRLVLKKDFDKQKESKKLVHIDDFDWGALIGLTPNKYSKFFLPFYRHKKTGLSKLNDPGRQWTPHMGKNSANLDAWEELHRVRLCYNRLILFQPRQFHALSPGFGTNKRNGKLFQWFDFNEA